MAKLYLNAEVYTGAKKYTDTRTYAEKVINGGTALNLNMLIFSLLIIMLPITKLFSLSTTMDLIPKLMEVLLIRSMQQWVEV